MSKIANIKGNIKRLTEANIELILHANLAKGIVPIVAARVEGLEKVGKQYHARCPFHREETPSFTVDPVAGTYHCFGCGEKGNAIKFLMECNDLPLSKALDAYSRESGFREKKLTDASHELLNALRYWPTGSETPEQKQRGLQALQYAIETALPAGEELKSAYDDDSNESPF